MWGGSVNEKNRGELLLGIILITFLMLPFATATITTDVGYIIKSSEGIDTLLLRELSRLNYTYQVIYENDLFRINLEEYKLIMIGDQNLLDAKSIPISLHKSFIINKDNFYKKSSTNYQLGWAISRSLKTSPTQLKIEDRNTDITRNLPTDFNAYTQAKQGIATAALSVPPQGTKVLVTASRDPVLATLEPGKRLLNREILQERSVFFGMTSAEYWTTETKTLFRNSLIWVLEGSDFDNDGVRSDSDCNDNDPSIKPGANEIPYDNIDQDCSGSDLNDVDIDGFISSRVQGPDCDDSDPTINPESIDKAKNCKNDKPILVPIQKITLFETEEVRITPHATDPENDPLTYTISDNRFSYRGDSFVWQTTNDDAGEYRLMLTALDGEFSDTTEVILEIKNKNRAPRFTQQIPDLIWDEDSQATLDLKDYVIDDDDDVIQFGIESTSEDTHITATTGNYRVITFTPEENFFGSDWIIFWAYDGKDKSRSNRITLRVSPIDDPVTFIATIPDYEWEEDSVLQDAINLKDFFKDPDSDLSFTVSGNNAISVTIDSGIVSFLPHKDFAGLEEIVFRATAPESFVESNSVKLTLIEKGEPPELNDLECETTIKEDTTHQCLIAASDFENNEITLTTKNEQNLRCTIKGNSLEYTPYQDYAGIASCTIVASDIHGKDEKKLEVLVIQINDSPRIISFTPAERVVLVKEGTRKEFSLSVQDKESAQTTIVWYVNGYEKARAVGTRAEFSFNEQPGSYLLEAHISDSSLTTITAWDVIVGSHRDLLCADAGGKVCSEKQTCTGSVHETKDTLSCCLTTCTSRFEDAKTCKERNDKIRIEIKDPKENKEFEAGEVMEIELELENGSEKDQDFDISMYLYDSKEDESLVEEKSSVEIKSRRSKTVKQEMTVPDSLDPENNLALLVVVEDDICNQDSIPIRIERQKEDIEILGVTLPQTVTCGEEIEAKVRVENRGERDQSLRIKIKNDKLKIHKESELFKLEKYGKDDRESRKLSLIIPQKVKSGTYTLEISALSSTEQEMIQKDVGISCVTEEVPIRTITEERTIITPPSLGLKKEQAEKKNTILPYLIIALLDSSVIALIIVALRMRKQKTVLSRKSTSAPST